MCTKYDKLIAKSYQNFDECMIDSFYQLTTLQEVTNLDATEFCIHRYHHTDPATSF